MKAQYFLKLGNFLYLWVTRTNEWKLIHLEEIFISSFFLDMSNLDFVFFIKFENGFHKNSIRKIATYIYLLILFEKLYKNKPNRLFIFFTFDHFLN